MATIVCNHDLFKSEWFSHDKAHAPIKAGASQEAKCNPPGLLDEETKTAGVFPKRANGRDPATKVAAIMRESSLHPVNAARCGSNLIPPGGAICDQWGSKMRLNDEDFARLVEMEELYAYFLELAPDEMITELLRLESPRSSKRLKLMNQCIAIYRSLSDVCANNKILSKSQRSYFITMTNVVQEALETDILDNLRPELADILLTRLISTDYNLAAFGFYPRAVDMLLTQARRPKGPYELRREARIAAPTAD